jgi:hypothetical protein
MWCKAARVIDNKPSGARNTWPLQVLLLVHEQLLLHAQLANAQQNSRLPTCTAALK